MLNASPLARSTSSRRQSALLLLGACAIVTMIDSAAVVDAQDCKEMRKINIGVSVTPPNVVHTTPFVAQALGLFAKRCIEANIIQFEGSGSPAAKAAIAQGMAITNLSDIAVGRGVKAQQFWGVVPRLSPVYAVGANIKTAADLKGKKLSAAGGGVGGFQWRMGREVLRTAGLSPDDVQFVAQGTAGRVPGIVGGQVDAVSLHPEDFHLAVQKNPAIHALVDLAKLLPNFVYIAYGAQSAWIARDRALLRDTAAAMIEANRIMYRDKDKVIPIMVEATNRPKEAVEFAWEVLTRNCVWGVNEGFNPERTTWTVDYDASFGDLDAAHKPTFEQVVNMSLATEAVEAAGGRVTIGNCTE
jgi:NitT/TauT family transport system substrate-binding protein